MNSKQKQCDKETKQKKRIQKEKEREKKNSASRIEYTVLITILQSVKKTKNTKKKMMRKKNPENDNKKAPSLFRLID